MDAPWTGLWVTNAHRCVCAALCSHRELRATGGKFEPPGDSHTSLLFYEIPLSRLFQALKLL